MPTFEFEAMNAEGKAIVDQVDARNQDEAIAKIRGMALFPTRVTQKKAETGQRRTSTRRIRKKSFTIGGVSGKDLTGFTRQLSTLTDAGIPIVQALNILEGQMRAGALKNIVGSVADEVEGGASLSEAMAKHPKAFDELYCNMVKAGETGGMLDLVLQRLADFREKAARLKRRVVGALIYPVAVLSIATLILAGLIKWIIPSFIDMFLEMEVKLPAATQLLLDITSWCTKYWYVLPAVPVGIFVLYKIIVSTRIGRLTVDWTKFHVPLFGSIVNKSAIARFTRTFGTLIGSGVPILEALNISRDTAGNMVLANAIQSVHDSVREGDPIAAPLGQSKVCDDIVVNMIDVGEETGNLDAMLMKVADNYDQEVDVAVEGLTRLMEPILVVGMGVVVGFIVIALFMPLVSIMSALSGSTK
ncbi:MAG: type II secretion system F family protein [Candidatus Brocadiaceae bacterium]|nr:type II secretion system F family protein [Candidatus Brocadiaceae bacterium]